MEILVAVAIMLPLVAFVALIWVFARRLGERARFFRHERERLEGLIAGEQGAGESEDERGRG